MDTTTLQIPMAKSLRDEASQAAKDYGFSSLQEIARVLFTKLAKRQLSISVEKTEEIQLSSAAQKRYQKMTEDFRVGHNIYHAKDIDDLFKHLNS